MAADMNNQKIIPMLFNREMVSALLDGRKTQTRRPVKPQPAPKKKWKGWVIESSNRKNEGCASWADVEGCRMFNTEYAKPPCKSGDLIYVRETFKYGTFDDCADCEYGCSRCPASGRPMYSAAFSSLEAKEYGLWKPSIHMPRSASRITLKVTDVRIEKIISISRNDALAEGIEHWNDTASVTPYRNYLKQPGSPLLQHFSIPELSFLSLWDATYKINSLKENPWVWVIEFELIKMNVDDYLQRAHQIQQVTEEQPA